MTCEVLDYRDWPRFGPEFYAKNRPAVIRGVARSGAKVFEWSAQHLAGIMKSKVVPVLETQSGFLSYERNTIDMPFDEFVRRSFGEDRTEGPYLYYKNPTQLLPDGHDDGDSIEGLGDYIANAVMRNLWVSGKGLTVGLHFDAAENFNFQLRGHKSFCLHPPGVMNYYPMPMFSQTAHISRVFREGPEPDLSRFPRFDPGSEIRVDLHEGDVLYLPAYWWHQVAALGDENVNLNYWWLPGLSKQLPNWNQALRGHIQVALRYLQFGNLQKAPTQEEAGRG
ncbi:MAG: cupin-like domain-containing protein [Myxococcales bacterium]|nr:cupin-like domain-containing protein [Myxococcales bacterium]